MCDRCDVESVPHHEPCPHRPSDRTHTLQPLYERIPGVPYKHVSYFHDLDVPSYYYGPKHPMKPARLALAHELTLAYGLQNIMDVHRPAPCSETDILKFHDPSYISFLKKISPDNMGESGMEKLMAKYHVGWEYDCPVFQGLFPFCQRYASGSLEGARRLCQGYTDIAINWSGGLHHAKRNQASGFCYVNDIVLGILEMLRYHARVLYIDIDIHHGDGVEEAFWFSDRVMTLSFHKFGGTFFPMTGDARDIGEKLGKHYSLNVPLQDGMTDEAYELVYKPIVAKVMEIFRPGAVVLQCGADSLYGDRLGFFNLSFRGHGRCVQFMRE